MLSIGGWGGSVYFSSSVGSADNRTAFAKSVMSVIEQYDLDGVEFEYAPFPPIPLQHTHSNWWVMTVGNTPAKAA